VEKVRLETRIFTYPAEPAARNNFSLLIKTDKTTVNAEAVILKIYNLLMASVTAPRTALFTLGSSVRKKVEPAPAMAPWTMGLGVLGKTARIFFVASFKNTALAIATAGELD